MLHSKVGRGRFNYNAICWSLSLCDFKFLIHTFTHWAGTFGGWNDMASQVQQCRSAIISANCCIPVQRESIWLENSCLEYSHVWEIIIAISRRSNTTLISRYSIQSEYHTNTTDTLTVVSLKVDCTVRITTAQCMHNCTHLKSLCLKYIIHYQFLLYLIDFYTIYFQQCTYHFLLFWNFIKSKSMSQGLI